MMNRCKWCGRKHLIRKVRKGRKETCPYRYNEKFAKIAGKKTSNEQDILLEASENDGVLSVALGDKGKLEAAKRLERQGLLRPMSKVNPSHDRWRLTLSGKKTVRNVRNM